MMEIKRERVLIVGVYLNQSKKNMTTEASMKELRGLVEAAGGEVVSEVIQNRDRIDAATYIGKGKAEEIKNYVSELEVDSVVFNNDLSGSQMRNLEELIDVKIVDRTTLILDIFASRATTAEGKLQVKLAQLRYRLPRLQGFGKALSRTGGGIGTRGPGEQKLDIDRRHIRTEIEQLESALKKISENREIKRKSRLSSELPIVSLVGYTNAGKSTIMNAFLAISKTESSTKEEKNVFVKDMLFATLDTSLRHIKLEEGSEFLLTDTVGFVSLLPTSLVEAFKSTLEEIVYSDLILNVVDLSDSEVDYQLETTEEILKDLNAQMIPKLVVYNKADKVETEVICSVREHSVTISAQNASDIRLLGKKIMEHLPHQYYSVQINLPFDDLKLLDYFSKHYSLKDLEYTESGASFEATVKESDWQRYQKYMKQR